MSRSSRDLRRPTRRGFCAAGATFALVPWVGGCAGLVRRPRFDGDPFRLGVASGDPDARGFVLWTRLAPRPLEPAGGMPPDDVEVRWEVAADEGMRRVVARGRAVAIAELGHSVHVELDGLEPNRWYWYRFRAGDAESVIGRTRTLPRAGDDVDRVRFVLASCQNYEQGLFTAYEEMAREDLDLVFHVGDYIYEYEAGRTGSVRTHLGPEVETLDQYRLRYAQYRADPLLAHAHAQCPWFVTWDDHEVDNNYANAVSEDPGIDPAAFLQRRANAYQAYYEFMPLRRRSMPRGPDMRLYRGVSFGRLAEFSVLDTRQYRTDQPNDDRYVPIDAAAMSPTNTMLGATQREWLERRLVASRARWNVLAQQVVMAQLTSKSGTLSMDQWPGYMHERQRLLRLMRDRAVANPVVLAGDIHCNWANELRIDDREPDQDIVACEFVTTSIASGGNGRGQPADYDVLLRNNPGVRYHDRDRGYVRCTVTPTEWRTDFMRTDEVERPGGVTRVSQSVSVESGRARVVS